MFRESDTDSGLPVVRASHSAKPENEKGVKTKEPYSPKYFALYEKFNHDGRFWKMFMDLLQSQMATISSAKLSHHWLSVVTRYNRLLYQLRPSGRGTDETEFGLCAEEMMLRTPDASLGGEGYSKEKLQQRIQDGLPITLAGQMDAIRYGLLPTPSTQESEHPQAEITETGRRKAKNGESHTLNLADTVRMLPTPTESEIRKAAKNTKQNSLQRMTLRGELIPTAQARDYKGGNTKTASKGRNPGTNNLADAIEIGTKSGMKLQPGFVEWMMGYPTNYTNLKLPTEWDG